MVYIDGVRFGTDAHGCSVITHLRWTNDLNSLGTNTATKQEFIIFINENPNCTKTKYKTYGLWFEGEDVRVIDNKYLRTDSNSIRADNLGNLPKF